MSNDQMAPETTDRRLNDLYWSSGLTIDEILNELGIGRATLYASIEPLRTGYDCRVCGGRLVFANRTHRAANSASCIACGAEQEVGAADGARTSREWGPDRGSREG